MTLTELEKLEALHAAATPGRWSPAVWQGNDDTGGWAAVGPHQESTECVCEGEEERTACAGEFCADDRSQNDEEQAMEDAKAIAALHNAFPALANALREALEDARKHREDALAWVQVSFAHQRERDEAQAEMDEFAVAVGYGERPEGQSGVHRLHGEQLADRWKQIERERDEALAEVERLRGIVEVNDRRLAAVWDEARAEVEWLREVVRGIHTIAERGLAFNAHGALRDIQIIANGATNPAAKSFGSRQVKRQQ